MYNGYTKTTPYRERIANLLEIIPAAERPATIVEAWIAAKRDMPSPSKYDFERYLSSAAWQYLTPPADYDATDPLALRQSQMTDASIVTNWDAIPEIAL